jgi:hypothetical protein
VTVEHNYVDGGGTRIHYVRAGAPDGPPLMNAMATPEDDPRWP